MLRPALYDDDYDDEFYPTSDGKPMAETDTHRDQMMDLIEGLKWFYRDRDDVYVSGNILMFYQKGDGRKHRSPDVLVTHGIPSRKRDHYKIWEEGKAPDLIIEITSASTRAEDLGEKKGLYEFLGVKEYLLFDPLDEYLEPGMRLYRNTRQGFLSVAGRLSLETVDLEPEVLDGVLRLRDLRSGKLLPTRSDLEDLAARAEAMVKEAEAKAGEAEARAERLAARLRELGVEE